MKTQWTQRDEAIGSGLMFVDAFARDRFTDKALEELK